MDVAAGAAHAIKRQAYTDDAMTLDLAEGEFFISDPNSLWAGQSLRALYQQAHTSWEWHEPIMARAQQRGMICFSSPFDDSAIALLETLDVPAYKIASFENTDLPLIPKAAGAGKPLIISTGLATIAEIADAVETARAAGCQNLVLLKCTSTYAASPENSDLRTIPHLGDLFACEVGFIRSYAGHRRRGGRRRVGRHGDREALYRLLRQGRKPNKTCSNAGDPCTSPRISPQAMSSPQRISAESAQATVSRQSTMTPYSADPSRNLSRPARRCLGIL